MWSMSKKNKEVLRKTRHSSLDMPEEKKKQDMLSKARNKLYNLSDVLKPRYDGEKKSLTQSTIDYFFKTCPNKDKQSHVYSNDVRNRRATSLQKQHSVGSYPIKIEVVSEDEDEFHPKIKMERNNCEPRETAALALERPRKKLSFREPEIMGYNIHVNKEPLPKRRSDTRLCENKKNIPNGFNRINSDDDLEVYFFQIYYFLIKSMLHRSINLLERTRLKFVH